MLKQKIFYKQVFEWKFANWGPNHISFSCAKIIGCFNVDAKVSRLGVLVVL
jgi:hypothetical protein